MFENIIPRLSPSGLTHLDCFCGAGIGEIGAERAGFNTIFAFDNNQFAVDTFNQNFNPVASVLDAMEFLKDSEKESIEFIKSVLPAVDVISGGFPCKPWSLIGANRGEKDEKTGKLGYIMTLIIKALQPKSFIIENVDGLVKKRNIEYFENMIQYLHDSGYDVYWRVLDSSDYGIPQVRKRVFVVGFRKDLRTSFNFPLPTSTALESKMTIREAFSGLPTCPDGLNEHIGYGLRNDEKPFVDKVPIGGNWKSLPLEDQMAFMKNGFYSGGGRTGALRKVDPDLPAKTIMSSPMGKMTAQIIDWSDGNPRRFTVRESLRLQSVPDSFSFVDDMTLAKKYERCSGIPSKLSFLLFQEVRKSLGVVCD